MLRAFYNIIQLPFGYKGLKAFKELETAMKSLEDQCDFPAYEFDKDAADDVIEAWRNFLDTVKG